MKKERTIKEEHELDQLEATIKHGLEHLIHMPEAEYRRVLREVEPELKEQIGELWPVILETVEKRRAAR